MEKLLIRMATTADAAAIQAIYAPYVADTTISFEETPPTVEEMTRRIEKVLEMYPYLVGTLDGKIIGYAYGERQMTRAAYQWNAQLSVYLDQKHVGSGMGGRLFRALLDVLTLQNVHNVYSGVTSPNPQSERLHGRFGFTQLGVYHRTGYKFGRWLDVIWFEKRLIEHEGEPLPVKSVHDIGVSELERIFSQAVG